MKGELFVVATPIGNLGDMVPRAIDVLQSVDVIAAEDTRHSSRLLHHFDISTRMLAYHDRGDESQLGRFLSMLEEGKTIALISDAGTPLISDPGYRLIREARAAGFRVTPVPGACAAIAALSAAGLPSDRFQFEGFPPAKQQARKKYLQDLAFTSATLIFYEAPHRILETLEDMADVFGDDREGVVCRELTKTFETFLTGTLAELAVKVASDVNQQRGEIVVLVSGKDTDEEETPDEQRRILQLLLQELPLKKAAALTAEITGGNKRALYQLGVQLKS